MSHSTKVFADKPLQQQAKHPVFSGAIIFKTRVYTLCKLKLYKHIPLTLFYIYQ